ncbi:MAG: hypothetical protein LBL52_04450 [Rickettsiales bacterium]|jgi:hypothetical protein|nr:hypothetical protein [Rickettsiales bacterium]
MEFIRRHKILAGAVGAAVFVLLLLWLLPRLVDLNSRRGYIEGKIKELTGYDAAVRGNISFKLLPQPSIDVGNVDLRLSRVDEGSEKRIPITFLSMNRMHIELDGFGFLKGDWKPETASAIGANFNFAAFQEYNKSGVDEFLRGESFGQVQVRNSTILLYKKKVMSNVNLKIKSLGVQGISAVGSFAYLAGKASNIDATLKYTDDKNYALDLEFAYAQNRNYVNANLKINSTESAKTLGGNIELATPNLRRFVASVDKEIELPPIPFLDDRINLKTDIKTTENAVVLSNGNIDSTELAGAFSANFPFASDDNGNLRLSVDQASVRVDLKRARLAKFVNFAPKKFTSDILDSIGKNPDVLDLLSRVRTHLSIGNLLIAQGAISNLSLDTAPGANGGVNIEKVSFSSGTGRFEGQGKLTRAAGGELALSASISTNIPFEMPNALFTGMRVNRAKCRLELARGKLAISDMDATIFDSRILGRVIQNGDVAEVSLASDNLDLRRFLPGKRVDMDFILKELALITARQASMAADFKRLVTSTGVYENFSVAAKLDGGDLSISKMTFNEGAHKAQIAGGLKGITSESGRFDNFTYAISSSDLKSVSIPIIKNSFLDRLISNGVSRIDIRMDGPAANPNSDISAEMAGIKVKINGTLLDAKSKYTLDFSHNELKGFLFSWGYLDESLLDYIYDGIPFRLRAEVEGSVAKNVVLDIKGNKLTGVMSDDEGKAKIDLEAKKFDIRTILKRIKDTDGYVDLALKIIRATPYDIRIAAEEAMNYDGNLYRDLDLSIVNSTNPGRVEFEMEKDGRTVELEAEILNNRIFEGTLAVKKYPLPSDMMTGAAVELASGTMDANIAFKTDGMNMYQLLSNLGGEFSAVVERGVVRGISGYDQLFDGIVGLANITPNNVLYIFAGAFKAGQLPFERIEAKGKVENAVIDGAAVRLVSKNMEANGVLTLNLMQKSLDLKSVFDIKNLSFETLGVLYTATGFFGNMDVKVDTQAILPKLNIAYLQKKKRDMRK